jgi:hypothetical protein
VPLYFSRLFYIIVVLFLKETIETGSPTENAR